MEFEEKLNISNSWIPVKALRNAAEIKDTYKKGFHRKTVSSPTGSPNKSAISVEVKANSPTSNTIHFNSLHSRYNTATLDIFPVPQDLPDASEKKYINNISRLNEEILIMSSQLKQANETKPQALSNPQRVINPPVAKGPRISPILHDILDKPEIASVKISSLLYP